MTGLLKQKEEKDFFFFLLTAFERQKHIDFFFLKPILHMKTGLIPLSFILIMMKTHHHVPVDTSLPIHACVR